MEKISIVRRRMEVPPTQAELRARQRMVLESAPGAPAGAPFGSAIATLPEIASTGEAAHGRAFSVDISSDVRDELWSGGHLEETPGGKRNFIVEAERSRADGHVVVKLEFMKPDYYLRLLTTEEVCEMLHISRSTLYQYSHSGEIRTYHMGRGLRYRFQDVLDFLTRCEVRKV